MKETKKQIAAQAIPWLLMAASMMSVGCENGAQGAVSGAGVGAVSGLVIGSLTGSAGKGAAIGAVVGGVGGAVVGDQNRRKNEQAAAAAAPPPPPPPQQVVVVNKQQPYVTGASLGRLIGKWQIAGTIDSGNGTPLPVAGTATGTVDKTYFVRLELSFTDPRSNESVQGSSVISQTGGRGIEMTNAFSSSPTVNQFRGDMDASGTIFDLKQFDPPNTGRRVTIRLSSDSQWTVNVWNGSKLLESYTFTRSNT